MTTLENNVNEGETAEASTITIPAVFLVHGARDTSATIDLTKYTASAVQAFVDQAVKVLCQRASASVEGVDKKQKAEQAKLEQIVNGDYKAGARRSAEPVSVEARAEQQLLMRLFEAFGANTEAKQKKLAKQAKPWNAYYLQAMSVKLNREDITSEEVEQVMTAQKDAIASMITTEIEAVKAEDKRKAKATTEVDFGDILGG